MDYVLFPFDLCSSFFLSDHEFITVMFSLENGIRMVISNLDDSDNIGSRRFLRVNK